MQSNVINLGDIYSSSQQMMQKLLRDFSEFEAHQLHLILEMCQYDYEVTFSLLRNTQKHQVKTLMKEMLNNPQEFFQALQSESNQQNTNFLQQQIKHDSPNKSSLSSTNSKQKGEYEESKDIQEKQSQPLNFKQPEQIDLNKEKLEYQKFKMQENEKLEIKQTQVLQNLLEPIPDHTLILIMDFLDPKSLARGFALVNKHLYELSKNPHIYQKYCLSLHWNVSKLPDLQNSPFMNVRNYVFENPLDFQPSIRQMASFSLKQLAWDVSPDFFRTSASYFKSFKNYYNMFIYAPRVHFAGVYRLRQQYFQIGEKDFNNQVQRRWVVTYYRYIRFFPDGRIRYCISNNQIKKELLPTLFKDSQIQYELQNPPNNPYFFSPPDPLNLTDMDDLLLNHYYTSPSATNILGGQGHVNHNNLHNPHNHYHSIHEQSKHGEREIHEGEYVKKEDQIVVQIPRESSIFEYQLNIMSTSQGAHNLLVVQNHNMFYLDTQYTYELYTSQKNSLKYFKYIPLPALREDIKDKQISHCTF